MQTSTQTSSARPRSGGNRGARGFTIIELLIVTAILSILAALAIPSYRSYVRRGKSAAAAQCLQKLLQAQERYRADQGTYAPEVTDLAAYSVDETCPIQNSGSGEAYDISLDSSTASAFVGRAKCLLTGSDTTDIWTINQDGKLKRIQDGT